MILLCVCFHLWLLTFTEGGGVISTDDDDVLVTGGLGGCGILASLIRVFAVSGKPAIQTHHKIK